MNKKQLFQSGDRGELPFVLRALRSCADIFLGFALVVLVGGALAWSARQQRTVASPGAMDVVFVFDDTGSMDDEWNTVINTSERFAEKLGASGADYRLGLVSFGDEIHVSAEAGLDASGFKQLLSGFSCYGGGDDPENCLDALVHAASLPPRPSAQQVLILITDDSFHYHGDGSGICSRSFREVKAMLVNKRISVYVVAPGYGEYIRLAEDTGGSFFDIGGSSDFSGILLSVAEKISRNMMR